MPRKRLLLVVKVLLFLLVTLLGIATGNLAHDVGVLPWGLEILRRGSLPLAGVIVVLIIGLMVWQYVTEERLALPDRPVWDSDRSPFPGLEAFTEQDSAVFFGRDVEIIELLERLQPVSSARVSRLVTIVGPSGVGKSSLVQAGLVPRLRQRRGGWIVMPTVVPGDRPLRSLARSLAAARPEWTVADVPDRHFADEFRITQGDPNAPVLVIVDQAEELITLSGRAERDEFLDLLTSALEADPRLWIIMILRAEFLNGFLGTRQARLFRNPLAVGALGQAALVEVIEQPARRAGLNFDPPTLPQQMAADAGSGDALPLLAYALQELCLAAGPRKSLTGEAYQNIGGVTGVLTRQADRAAAELGGADPAGLVCSTLLTFVTIGENEPTRRRVPCSALTEAQWPVAEAFIAARLLTSNGDGEDASLEVAHEALFRAWAPLRQAIEVSLDQLRWRADLERWARDWENSDREDAYLLRDERLKAAQRWANTDGNMLDALVSEFLICSNRADRATMLRLSETIARQSLAAMDSDPDYALLLALTAYEECAPCALAIRAVTAALVASVEHVVLHGHDDEVRAVAWSPEGKRLATASSDQTVRIWDVDSGSELVVLRGHDQWIRRVAWSPDGRRLATASNDRTARVWDAYTGSQLAVLHHVDGSVCDVGWSPEGGRLATASEDRTARIWDAESGSELAVLNGHDDDLWGLAWSPDGRLATASRDRTARIWDADRGNEASVLRGHDDGGVRDVVWSPDGLRLATASDDCTARIWDAASGKELTVFSGHGDELRGVAWSPDGRRLATASIDRTARIWDAEAGSTLVTLRGHNGPIRGVAWSPDGYLLATASNDRTARIWNTRGGSELAVLYGHHGWVQTVAWSSDSRRLATASHDRTTRIWDANTAGELAVLLGHVDWIWCVAWSPDGRKLATGSRDRTARIWDTTNGNELVVLHGHNSEIRCVAWSPDGRTLATGSRDRTTRIWDTNTGNELAVLSGDYAVWWVAWSPDGQRIATALSDHTARIWDANNSNELAVLHGHDDWVWCVAWSPDSRRLATASRDRTVRVWDATSGRTLAVLGGHDGEVRAVAWSPDGRQLTTGSRDQTIRIWDGESGAELIVIGAHLKGVEAVSWSPDGKRVASSSQDGTTRIWNAIISIEELIANAHRRISRELSPEERRNLMLPRPG